MKIILTLVFVAIAVIGIFLVWRPEPKICYGTRSYYSKDRYLVATVYGEYLGGCFIPFVNVSRWLNQEQVDSIVLIETIPDR